MANYIVTYRELDKLVSISIEARSADSAKRIMEDQIAELIRTVPSLDKKLSVLAVYPAV